MIIIPRYNIGIDSEILRIQKILDNLDYDNIFIYGRLNKTISAKGDDILETYTQNGEYKDVFINDIIGGSVGFYVINREFEQNWKATTDIIFTIDLEKASDKVGRYDEVLLREAINLLQENGIKVNSIKNGVDDVFSDFTTEVYKHRDMHPFFVFSINIDIYYDNQNCITNL